MPAQGVFYTDGVAGLGGQGAVPGQPPDVSQPGESVACREGRVPLGRVPRCAGLRGRSGSDLCYSDRTGSVPASQAPTPSGHPFQGDMRSARGRLCKACLPETAEGRDGKAQGKGVVVTGRRT